MSILGEKTVLEYVKFIPARVKRMVVKTQTLICRCLEKTADITNIIEACAPKLPLPQSIAGPELLAEVFGQKFITSIPLYRQRQFWQRTGLALSDRTLCNWIITAANKWLAPVYELLHERLQNEPVLHGDETPYTLLERNDDLPDSKKSYFWLFTTGEATKQKIAFYHANESRGRNVITALFFEFQGFMHCDGYAAYKNIEGMKLVGCWAHLRRKFHEVPGTDGKGKIGVNYCNQLFAIERKLKQLTPEERQQERLRQSKPIVVAFYQWLDSFIRMKGALGTAVGYAFKQKLELTQFLLDGRLALSNNVAERSIRPITIGRKNYLFSKNIKGARANAMAYTIIETAKLNQIDPLKYLEYLFKNLPNCPDINNKMALEAYLPWAEKIQVTCAKI